MRLSDKEIEAIRKAVLSRDSEARVYLFGSRADDSKRGGDIDLLVLSGKLSDRDKYGIKFDLYDELGEQKIDIIITPEPRTTIARIAYAEGILI